MNLSRAVFICNLCRTRGSCGVETSAPVTAGLCRAARPGCVTIRFIGPRPQRRTGVKRDEMSSRCAGVMASRSSPGIPRERCALPSATPRSSDPGGVLARLGRAGVRQPGNAGPGGYLSRGERDRHGREHGCAVDRRQGYERVSGDRRRRRPNEHRQGRRVERGRDGRSRQRRGAGGSSSGGGAGQTSTGGNVGTGGTGTGGTGTGGTGSGGMGTGGTGTRAAPGRAVLEPAGRGPAELGPAVLERPAGLGRGTGRGGGMSNGGAGGQTLPSMFAYYPFDQTAGPTITDASGNGRNGTLSGTATFPAGVIGNRHPAFGASGDYVTLPSAFIQTLTNVSYYPFGSTSTRTRRGNACSILCSQPERVACS